MNEKNLTIIQMNDLHGYMEEHYEYFFNGREKVYEKVGGLSRIATYLEDVRKAKSDNVLFLDGGDTFHGTYPVVHTKGKILIELLNKLKIDGMTAHWDFAYGIDGLKEILKELSYPMVAVNAYDEKSNELVFNPYIIKEVNDLKVGIIGIAATIVDKVMPQHFSEGIYFTLGNLELPKYIKTLKEEKEVDLIIVLSHLGFSQDVKLSKEVSGIDVLLSAHTHNRLYEPVKINETLIIQSGCHGSFLGHLDIKVKDKEVVSYNHQLVVLDKKIKKNEKMETLVKKKLLPYKTKLDEVVGKTLTNLDRSEVFESTMDNFLLQAILDKTKREVAFSNGWRYGVSIPLGDISVNDLWNIIPVNPKISLVQMDGKEIWEMLEENIERTFSTDPYKQMGGYLKRSLGLKVYFKVENSYPTRIQQLFINDKPIDLKRIYDVAYVTTQGVPLKYGKNRKDLEIDIINVLKEYVEKEKIIKAPLRRTFIAI